jgi:hypothetical protein
MKRKECKEVNSRRCPEVPTGDELRAESPSEDSRLIVYWVGK